MKLLCYLGEFYERCLISEPFLNEEYNEVIVELSTKNMQYLEGLDILFFELLDPFMAYNLDEKSGYIVPKTIYEYFSILFDSLEQSSSDIDDNDFENMRKIPYNLYGYYKDISFLEDLKSEISYGTRGILYSEFVNLFKTKQLLEKLEILSENMNTRIEELQFLVSIIIDLKTNYKEHNKGILETVLQTLKYQLELEELQNINKYKEENKNERTN